MKINIKNINIKSICATLFISLFLSCNNGIEELEKQRDSVLSISKLRQNFLDIFTSFGEITGTVLGFNKDTKKSEVADYFKTVKETVEGVKSKLNTIVENMRAANNPNATSTETAVNNLVTNTLDKIIKGAKTASEAIGTDSNLIANVADQTNAKGIAGTGVDRLIEGIKNIVGIVLKNEGKHDAGDTIKAGDSATERNSSGNDGACKLFDGNTGATTDGKKAAIDAAKAVGAVTGADILKAIAKNNDSAKLAKYNGNIASVSVATPKDATIAGAIVLRTMDPGGKFANGTSGNAADEAIKGVAVSAVTKALNTLTIAIRKTIDEGLKAVKEAININANDVSVTTEAGVVTK
ncbi:variable large family protein [Borrelia coriaceae]|nr:variable large family protein [Borrelia coriaceae]